MEAACSGGSSVRESRTYQVVRSYVRQLEMFYWAEASGRERLEPSDAERDPTTFTEPLTEPGYLHTHLHTHVPISHISPMSRRNACTHIHTETDFMLDSAEFGSGPEKKKIQK